SCELVRRQNFAIGGPGGGATRRRNKDEKHRTGQCWRRAGAKVSQGPLPASSAFAGQGGLLPPLSAGGAKATSSLLVEHAHGRGSVEAEDQRLGHLKDHGGVIVDAEEMGLDVLSDDQRTDVGRDQKTPSVEGKRLVDAARGEPAQVVDLQHVTPLVLAEE